MQYKQDDDESGILLGNTKAFLSKQHRKKERKDIQKKNGLNY